MPLGVHISHIYIYIYCRHEILYKQDVMTEDVFLGLGDKDPSTAHCDAMVVRIVFPAHKLRDIDLDVKAQKLVAQSHKLYENFKICSRRYATFYR
jgi:hypothetical protein